MKHKIILKSVCNLLFQSLQANFWNLFVFYKSKARKPFGYVIIHIVFTCKWNWSIKYYCKWNIQVLPDRCFIHQIYFQYFFVFTKVCILRRWKKCENIITGHILTVWRVSAVFSSPRVGGSLCYSLMHLMHLSLLMDLTDLNAESEP